MTQVKQIKRALPQGVIDATAPHLVDNTPVEPVLATQEGEIEQQSALPEIPQSQPVSHAHPVVMSEREKEAKRLAYETQMTKGIFRNFEKPGQMHEFTMRLEKGPVQKFKLYDGKVHELPRNVARYINQYCWHAEHETAMDEYGDHKNTIGKKIQRFSFDNGEYFEDAIPGLVLPNGSQRQFIAGHNKLIGIR